MPGQWHSIRDFAPKGGRFDLGAERSVREMGQRDISRYLVTKSDGLLLSVTYTLNVVYDNDDTPTSSGRGGDRA